MPIFTQITLKRTYNETVTDVEATIQIGPTEKSGHVTIVCEINTKDDPTYSEIKSRIRAQLGPVFLQPPE
jgi:hypothetical protein